MIITIDQLVQLAGRKTSLIPDLVQPMNVLFPIWSIDSLRLAHFLAQFCHETDGFNTLEEYASGDAYEGRDDLGNTQPGDGRRYKGRGGFQTTGRGNYARLQNAIGVPVLSQPELLTRPSLGVLSSCIYWANNRLERWADADDAVSLGRVLNRGSAGNKPANGEEARLKLTTRAKAIFISDGPLVTVADLQKALNDLGFGPLTVDNISGPKTEGAIRAFQKANGLAVTGKPDSKTRDAIVKKGA